MTYTQLYATVKAAFIARHDSPVNSLNKWCIANNVHRQNARDALLNKWKGKTAIELRNRLAKEAGISLDNLQGVDDAAVD